MPRIGPATPARPARSFSALSACFIVVLLPASFLPAAARWQWFRFHWEFMRNKIVADRVKAVPTISTRFQIASIFGVNESHPRRRFRERKIRLHKVLLDVIRRDCIAPLRWRCQMRQIVGDESNHLRYRFGVLAFPQGLNVCRAGGC